MTVPTEELGLANPTRLIPRALAFVRSTIACLFAVGSVLLSGLALGTYAFWAYNIAAADNAYVFMGYTWTRFLRALIEPQNLLWLVGLPVGGAILALLARRLTRSQRAAGELKRGTLASLASRFGRAGWLMSIAGLLIFVACFAYRFYQWRFF